MQAIRSAHGNSQIIKVEKFPVIDAFVLEVLRDNPSAAFALLKAWNTDCETNPHRKTPSSRSGKRVYPTGSKARLVREIVSFA